MMRLDTPFLGAGVVFFSFPIKIYNNLLRGNHVEMIRARTFAYIFTVMFLSNSLIGSIEVNPEFPEPPVLITTEQVNVVIEVDVYNMTNQRILQEIERFEAYLLSPEEIANSTKIFSLSTIIKSMNVSNSLIYNKLCELESSLISDSTTLGCLNSPIMGGEDNIPSQTQIDLFVGELHDPSGRPRPLLRMLVADSNLDNLLDNYRLIIATKNPELIRQRISQFINQETSVEVPCLYDYSGAWIESEGLCTWDEFRLTARIADEQTLQGIYGFKEQGIIVDNLEICPESHILDDCSYWKNSSLVNLNSHGALIDYTSILEVMPITWGNWSGHFETDAIVSISEDFLASKDCGVSYFECSGILSLDPHLLLILASYENSSSNPFSFLVNDSADFNLVWIHTYEPSANEQLALQLQTLDYRSIDYALDESQENGESPTLLLGIVAFTGIVLVYSVRRTRQKGIENNTLARSEDNANAHLLGVDSNAVPPETRQHTGPWPSSDAVGMLGADGYEWITFPPNSQNFYFRTPGFTHWTKWEE
jgi:hypothetical protein